MPESIKDNAERILRLLAEQPRGGNSLGDMTGHQIWESTGLEPEDINDAVAILEDSGLAEGLHFMGTMPYHFGQVHITPRGRFEIERAVGESQQQPDSRQRGVTTHVPAATLIAPSPVGSPYGFQEEDWEIVSDRKSKADTLFVVMGFQFASEKYDRTTLVTNIRASFQRAIDRYAKTPGALPVMLDFRELAAGYGAHLFNEIARDIISADIAVFDTSDLNPNVMLELGVALTWGVRALPIRNTGSPAPPSDVSGQTWAEYKDSATLFTDQSHEAKLFRMVERAVKRKASGRT